MPHIRIVTASELSASSLLARDYIKEPHGSNVSHELDGSGSGTNAARSAHPSKPRRRALHAKPLAKTKG